MWGYDKGGLVVLCSQIIRPFGKIIQNLSLIICLYMLCYLISVHMLSMALMWDVQYMKQTDYWQEVVECIERMKQKVQMFRWGRKTFWCGMGICAKQKWEGKTLNSRTLTICKADFYKLINSTRQENKKLTFSAFGQG